MGHGRDKRKRAKRRADKAKAGPKFPKVRLYPSVIKQLTIEGNTARIILGPVNPDDGRAHGTLDYGTVTGRLDKQTNKGD